MKNITITISGEAATGKSRLMFYLEKFFKKEGFAEVEITQDKDYPTEEIYRRVMNYSFEKAIKDIKSKTKITLKQVQINKTTEDGK